MIPISTKKVKTKFHGLVNRKRVIATAEDKANITDFRFIRPQVIPQGFVEKRNKKGDFLYYTLTEPVTIRDVDGREKHSNFCSNVDAVVTFGKKIIWQGVWNAGSGNPYKRVLDVLSPNGSFLFDIAPEQGGHDDNV